jgi:hypothetical protein
MYSETEDFEEYSKVKVLFLSLAIASPIQSEVGKLPPKVRKAVGGRDERRARHKLKKSDRARRSGYSESLVTPAYRIFEAYVK